MLCFKYIQHIILDLILICAIILYICGLKSLAIPINLYKFIIIDRMIELISIVGTEISYNT